MTKNTEYTAEYQGHLPNGNPVQAHSAGEYYPCILFRRGLDADTRYYILFDGIDYYMGRDQAFQVETAKRVMQVHTGTSPEDSRDIKEQKLVYTKHKRHALLLEASDIANKEHAVPTENKTDPTMFALYYSVVATAKAESDTARSYVHCLKDTLNAALQGKTVCSVLVPKQYCMNIKRSFQTLGFDVQTKGDGLGLVRLSIKWS